ncbi:hypothetical protein KXD40_007986 [Peronospora effusa]|uniref:Uncharacterized protein n=1 Tax=Peronospora effusa TaxID=542832 RepID=A0A3R7W8Y5_9STRA|nr:hypothetical protein DD237_004392 [Peronospora effusa]UIZ23608.1 hypothetical protein KXD40_007986 [Peronospora effusa]
MPPKVSSPELHEPYENYLYADLRHELSVRHIRLPRRLTNRVSFIKLLRDWDKKNPTTIRTNLTRTPMSTRRTMNSGAVMNSTRIIRARRGCRFRLINVLLSPDFNDRWGTMAGKLEVNQLWRDVHAAFMTQNSMLDAMHFHDALFVNVTPNVILPHSASRLLQMWVEIVAMYRNAVAQAKEAATQNKNTHSFFDFCAGRLDLLYLHMAMLLEPKLYKFILSDKIPISEPFGKRKTKTQVTTALAAKNGKPEEAIKDLARSAEKPLPGKVKVLSVPTCASTHAATATITPVIAATISTAPSNALAAAATAATHSKSSRVPTQNPEMEEVQTVVGSTAPAVAATLPQLATAKASTTGMKAKQTKQFVLPHTPAAPTKPQQTVDQGKARSGAGGAESAKDAKAKVSPSRLKPTASQPKAVAANKPSQNKSSVGDKPADGKMSSLGKRPREVENTAIVEVPSVSDIVPHSGKRVHTTTTISTALAPRPTDVMLPPDEWDILESRLRKVNENIDRCHRGLASVEMTVSENYKQSLEADLRFYSAIKQRLQEQLLVVMQSGY